MTAGDDDAVVAVARKAEQMRSLGYAIEVMTDQRQHIEVLAGLVGDLSDEIKAMVLRARQDSARQLMEAANRV
ncbi:MAG: hypothetical protein QM750_11690 [Rubrivivax sp.]